MARKSKLAARFLTIFNQLRKSNANSVLLLALSGGLDSVVLFDLLLKNKIPFAVAHCNFQLRGEESEKDTLLVQDSCKSNKIRCFTKYFDTTAYAELRGVSIEMAARELRYDWFNELKTTHAYDVLATAHHAGDNFETALINLTKGTGIAGLKGMLPISNGLIRPLLAFSKEELLEYACSQQLVWREDESNNENEFQRNFLRNEVVPKLKALNPNLEHTFSNSSWRIGLWAGVLQEKLLAFDEKYGGEFGWEIPRTLLETTEGSAVLVEFLNSKGFEIKTVRAFIEKKNKKTGAIFQGSGVELIVERETFNLINSKKIEQVNLALTFNSEFETSDGRKFTIEEYYKTPDFTSANTVYFEKDKLKLPLRLRNWQQGDRMQPFGMNGSKLISDILIDAKISNTQKKGILVLLSENEIVWLLGLRTSEKFKISDPKKPLVRIIYQN